MLFKALSVLLLSAFSAFAISDDVIVLDATNFHSVVGAAPLIMVEFYAPWCGHCKHLEPEYKIAAAELKLANIPIAKYDADNEANRGVAQEFGIRGFPTLKIFRHGDLAHPTDYEGERTAEGIISFMKKQALPAVSELADAAAVTKFSGEDKVVVVGFFASATDASATEFGAVADKLRNKYLFGRAPVSAGADFGLTGAGVVLFKKFDEGKNVLAGEITQDSLSSFIGTHSVPLIDEIGPENYRDYVESGIPLGYLFVDTGVAGQKEEYVAKIDSIAKSTKGKINWVWIDWVKFAKHSERLGLSGKKVPAVAIEKAETHWAYPESDEISTELLTKWVAKFIIGGLEPTIKSEEIPAENNGPVRVIVAKTYASEVVNGGKDVLLEFYAPWCGHCKQLAPIYEELGKKFAGDAGVTIAKMDATANDVDPKLGVRGFPTIKFFPAGKAGTVIEYEGDRSLEDFVSFINSNRVTVAAAAGSKDEL